MLLFRSISTLSLLTYCAIALGNGVYSSVEATDSTKHKRKKVVKKTTYSTKKLKSESFDKRFIAAPLDILRGKVAGVNIAHSGAERLAMLNSVRVRGTTSVTAGNDPLVIIDGVSSDLSSLSTIYPADIASFTILKNASETAIYGSRGASGVILVTTKKGAAGKFKISYDTNIGVEHTTSEIQVLNGSQYISTAKALNQFAIDGGYNTNFQKEITRVGFIQNHHLAFSGGVDESNYRASVSYSGHEMVVKNNNYNNFTAKFDLNQKAFDNVLTVNLGIFGSSTSVKNLADIRKLIYSSIAQNPTYPAHRNASGNWDLNSGASQIPPPLAYNSVQDHENGVSVITHINFDVAVAQPLHLKLFSSYAFNSLEHNQYFPVATEAQGKAYRQERKTEDWLINFAAQFHQKWGEHVLDLEAQTEYQKSTRTAFNTTVKGFMNDEWGYNNLGAGSIHPQEGTFSSYASPSLLSFLVTSKYKLLNTYTLSATLRADGSSLVAPKNRWGFFPSVALEWDIKREPWLRYNRVINALTLKTSYGMSGNLGGIQSYNAQFAQLPAGVVPYWGVPTITLGHLKNINPDLKWENKNSFNIGIETALWQNKLVFTAEYYYSKTRNMLYNYRVSVPPFVYNTLLANIGSMSNSGFELGLGFTPIITKDLSLNINLNVAFQKNKLLSLSGTYRGENLSSPNITPIASLDGAGFHGGQNNIVYQIVGQPLGVFYLPHSKGLATNQDGSKRYNIVDLDNNNEINIEDGGDRYIAGQAIPKATLGSNISIRYKNWDASLQMNGAFGHKIYNATALSMMNMSSFPDYNVMRKAPEMNIKDQRATDYWLEKGDYLNFDYLTLGYNFDIKSKFISALRLSLSVNNLATITSYSGVSPMINSFIVGKTLGIEDKNTYPTYRSYSISVGIQF